MPITLEQLQKRLTEAQAQREQLLQQLNGTVGVIADLEYWIALEQSPEPAKES